MSEDDLLAAVREMARLHHWLTYHTYRSDRSEPGFPDIVLVRPPRLLFMELKSDKGKLTEEQAEWMALLEQVLGVECALVRPSDWISGAVERWLA